MNAELPVSGRIRQLRTELLSTGHAICFERAKIITRSYRETEGEHVSVRRARALAAVFSEMPIFIRDGELIVGQRASRLGAMAVYPEYHLHGLAREKTPAEVWDYWRAGRKLICVRTARRS